ncbi:hypothetical protein VPHD164_0054 [Vibrio phage D164]
MFKPKSLRVASGLISNVSVFNTFITVNPLFIECLKRVSLR